MREIDKLQAELAEVRDSAREKLSNGGVSRRTRRLVREKLSRVLDLDEIQDMLEEEV